MSSRSLRLARTRTGRVVGAAMIAGTATIFGAFAFGTALLLVAAAGVAPGVPLGALGEVVVRTLGVVVAAGLVAAPLGVGAALWAARLAPRVLRAGARRSLWFLARVPPIAWALVALALTGSDGDVDLGLAVVGLIGIATPAVAGHALEVLERLPDEDLLQAMALGATRSQAVARIDLPRAWTALARSGLAGLSRAVGDTLVVLLVLDVAGPGTLTRGIVLAARDGDVVAWAWAAPLAVLAAAFATLAWATSGRTS